MKRVLYLTFSKRAPDNYYQDGSVIYRCIHPCEFLRAQSFNADVVHYLNVFDLDLTHKKYDIVIFHRPFLTDNFDLLIQHFEHAQVIADFDDCLFDSSIIDSHPALLSGQTSKTSLLKNIHEYQSILKFFSRFTVTTHALKSKLLDLKPDCTVTLVPNGISNNWVSLFNSYTKLYQKPEKLIISYFSGTKNHGADLDLHISKLTDLVDKYSNIEIHLYGCWPFADDLVKGFVSKKPVHFNLLPLLISQSSLCIAPLEDSDFNRCKSNIKILEAISCFTPIITDQIGEHNLQHPGIFPTQCNWVNVIDNLDSIDFTHSNIQDSLAGFFMDQCMANFIEAYL